jgi:hypothetical protein
MVAYSILLALASWIAMLLRILLGQPGWSVPLVGVAGVVVVARLGRRAHHRWLAPLAGIFSGAPLPWHFLAAPFALLFVGALAHRTRLMFPVRGVLPTTAFGTAAATLALGVMILFPGREADLTLGRGGWPWAVGGLVATGLLTALIDRLVESSPGFRHAITRV